MDVKGKKVLVENDHGYTLEAEIVDFSKEGIQDFEVYEIIEEQEDLNDEEKKSLSKLVQEYVKSYAQHKDEMKTKDWLLMMFKKDIPNKTEEELEEIILEITNDIDTYYSNLKEIKKYRSLGLNSNDWFADKIIEKKELDSIENVEAIIVDIDNTLTNQGIDNFYKLSEINIEKNVEETDSNSVSNTGTNKSSGELITTTSKMFGQEGLNKYFSNIDKIISESNSNMMKEITNLDGSISMNPNLDGFIAEQLHAATFNIDAATKEITGISAEALSPVGKPYGKDSVDIVITLTKDGKEEIIKNYQAKYGKNSSSTKNMLNRGDYSDQTPLVPQGQSEYIENSVENIEYGNIESQAISKEGAKDKQEKVQDGDTKAANLNFKDHVPTKAALKRIGTKVVRNSIMSATISGALNVGKKVVTGEEIEVEEVVVEALKTGGEVGLSTAVSGALMLAKEKGIIKGLLADSNIITSIAFSTVECLGVLGKIGNGEYSLGEGINEIGGILTASYFGTKAAFMGATGFTALAGMMAAPAAIVTVAGVVGSTLAYMAGKTIVKAVYDGATAVVKGVVSAAKSVVSAGYSAVKSVASGVVGVISSIGSAVGSAISSFGSWVSSWF